MILSLALALCRMFGQQLARSDKCAFDLHMHSLTQWLEPTNICHCPKGEYAQMAAQMALLLQRFHLAAWNDYFVDQLINLPSTCEKPANCCMVQFGEKNWTSGSSEITISLSTKFLFMYSLISTGGPQRHQKDVWPPWITDWLPVPPHGPSSSTSDARTTGVRSKLKHSTMKISRSFNSLAQERLSSTGSSRVIGTCTMHLPSTSLIMPFSKAAKKGSWISVSFSMV